jgi:hypothetical protein
VTWRLMWHPGLAKSDPPMESPVSFMSSVVANDTEARVMAHRLKDEGYRCIGVTAAGADKIMRGLELKGWIAQTEGKSCESAGKARVSK